ncbi:hypothetical protein SGPA1_21997 [Streptomyces misionensis JCM 4497]
MLTERQGKRLLDWLDAVRQDDPPSLHTLAAGIDRDRDAVTAGLTLPWCSGAVEGHVNRINTTPPTATPTPTPTHDADPHADASLPQARMELHSRVRAGEPSRRCPAPRNGLRARTRAPAGPLDGIGADL